MVSHVWFNANDMSFCRGRGINSGLSREIEKRKTHPIDWHRLCEWNSVLWKKKQTPVSVHGRLKFMPSGRLCSHHGVMCVPLQGFQWLVTCYIYSPGMVQVLVQESGLRGTWQLAKKKKRGRGKAAAAAQFDGINVETRQVVQLQSCWDRQQILSSERWHALIPISTTILTSKRHTQYAATTVDDLITDA